MDYSIQMTEQTGNSDSWDQPLEGHLGEINLLWLVYPAKHKLLVLELPQKNMW